MFTIFLSLSILVAGITVLVFFSIELGVIHSVVLGMCILAALFFLAMSSHYLVNRRQNTRMGVLQDQSLSQGSVSLRSRTQGVCSENTQVLDEIQRELHVKSQQIQKMEKERELMSTRISELESEVVQYEENRGRIRGFEEKEHADLSVNSQHYAFESRIKDLEEALAASESQSEEHASALQTEREQLQSCITELRGREARIEELETIRSKAYSEMKKLKKSLDQEESNNGLIAKRYETQRIILERQRDELRRKCFDLEAQLVQLEACKDVASTSVLERNKSQYESKIAELNQRRKNALEQISKLKEELKEKEEKILSCTLEYQGKQRHYEEEITQLKQSQSQAIVRMQELEQELAAAVKATESQVQTCLDEEHEKIIKELEEKCSTLRNTIQDLQSERPFLLGEGEGQQAESFRAIRTELEGKINDLQKENQSKLATIQKLSADVQALSDSKVHIQEKCTKQINRNKKIKLELEESKSTISDLQKQMVILHQEMNENNRAANITNQRNRELVAIVQEYSRKTSMELTSDPERAAERAASLAKLEQERRKIRTHMQLENFEHANMANLRIERLKRLSKDSVLADDVSQLEVSSKSKIDYQKIFDLENDLFGLVLSENPVPVRNHVDSMRALRLQQYCDGDIELEERVREFNFPQNAPIDSVALYELEQEVLDLREVKLFSLREELEESRDYVGLLDAKIKEFSSILASYEEKLSPNTIETRSLAEQQELLQVNEDLRKQLEEARAQLEDYTNRFSEAQNQILQISLELQSKDLALQVAEDKLKQFKEKE
ncbi:IncA family protein [Chlamydia sp. 12-01]|uniref:IncA family protein n=1 Tax=Chlamydia sp. 12-01 TaxID=3002742 RepID=UPI0035D4299F